MRVQSWGQYVRRITGTMTIAQISDHSGVPQTNVGRWLRGENVQPKADSVIAFAKAFNQPVVEALVAAGYVERADVAGLARTPLAEYSQGELLDELRRRTRD